MKANSCDFALTSIDSSTSKINILEQCKILDTYPSVFAEITSIRLLIMSFDKVILENSVSASSPSNIPTILRHADKIKSSPTVCGFIFLATSSATLELAWWVLSEIVTIFRMRTNRIFIAFNKHWKYSTFFPAK